MRVVVGGRVEGKHRSLGEDGPVSCPSESADDELDLREPGNEPPTFPLPRRGAGQSGVAAYPGVTRPAGVSGEPPWEPAPKPPDMSYAPSSAAAFHGLTWANWGWRASRARLWYQRARAWWRPRQLG